MRAELQQSFRLRKYPISLASPINPLAIVAKHSSEVFMLGFLIAALLPIFTSSANAAVHLKAPSISCSAIDKSTLEQQEFPLLAFELEPTPENRGEIRLKFQFPHNGDQIYSAIYSEPGLIVAKRGANELLRVIRREGGAVELRLGIQSFKDGHANSKDLAYELRCGDQLDF
jgi:hypothetical protein